MIVIKERVYDVRKICETAARLGYLKVLQWLFRQGLPFNAPNCAREATIGGHLEVLKWFDESNFAWDSGGYTCGIAAMWGHLEMLQWAMSKGSACYAIVCAVAAERGDLPMLEWARANNVPWDESVCTAAAKCGHLGVLQWAREHGAPWNISKCLRVAGEGRHLVITSWIRESQALASP